MNTAEMDERGVEARQDQGALLEKSSNYFSFSAKKFFCDDRSFLSSDGEMMLHYSIWKYLLSIGGTPIGILEATDQLIDGVIGDQESFSSIAELGPKYIEAYLKSGIDNIGEFLKEVADGNIIF
jgi:hypothetical protein